MGVVNVTPDSFSDGGVFFDRARAIEQVMRLCSDGADIVDIGGESSRPGAQVVSEEEELERVIPVIEGVAGKISAPISVDTTKVRVAEAAIQAGAAIVNDIAGNRKDPTMWRLVAATGAGYVLMHMKGTPQSMQAQADYSDVAGEVKTFFEERLRLMTAAGMGLDQVALDVGLGFAKTCDHNLQLLAALPAFTTWCRPVLVGASRKSFIGQITGAEDAATRLAGSLACACWAVAAGANIIRAHDVAATRQAILMTEAIAAQKK